MINPLSEEFELKIGGFMEKEFVTVQKEDKNGKYVVCCWQYSEFKDEIADIERDEWTCLKGKYYLHSRCVRVTYQREEYDFYILQTGWDEYSFSLNSKSIGSITLDCVRDHFDLDEALLHSDRYGPNPENVPLEELFRIRNGKTYWREMMPSEFMNVDFAKSKPTLEDEKFWKRHSCSKKNLSDATMMDKLAMMRRYITETSISK